MSTLQGTILIVEDDPNDILLLQRAFRKTKLPHPVQIVSDGEAAVAYLAGQGSYADREQYPLPFLMLLDLKLPRKSGFEVLTWLRQQPGLRRLPVIVLTSSNRNPDIDQAYDLGANSYLVKPVSFDDLSSLLQSLSFYWTDLNMKPDLHTP
jgi:CheY-like chemotaxis protein